MFCFGNSLRCCYVLYRHASATSNKWCTAESYHLLETARPRSLLKISRVLHWQLAGFVVNLVLNLSFKIFIAHYFKELVKENGIFLASATTYVLTFTHTYNFSIDSLCRNIKNILQEFKTTNDSQVISQKLTRFTDLFPY